SRNKIQFKVDTVKYMGHIITAAGQRADDTKIKANVDMPTQEDKQSLQRLLGMTKFLAQYIPNEASLKAPLRQLLKKDIAWQWCPHHSAALQTLKSTLTQPLTLQADSSKDGLGACLLQDGRPVCYASRALTNTEKRYAQIEKELLAIVEIVSDHLTHSSPGCPSSNETAERAIKTVKHALKKATQTGTDQHLVLLSLRNTPVKGLNESPAQMLKSSKGHTTMFQCRAETVSPTAYSQQNTGPAVPPKATLRPACKATASVAPRRYSAHADATRLGVCSCHPTTR
uniref:Reverse transcriptase RNase H-like domain-containing protein n=1 Tax=Scophthalmus maximus TaxID=52904 RepID=A0A8D3CRT6_SCOMX